VFNEIRIFSENLLRILFLISKAQISFESLLGYNIYSGGRGPNFFQFHKNKNEKKFQKIILENFSLLKIFVVRKISGRTTFYFDPRFHLRLFKYDIFMR
jgi:hypothetical protein